MKNWRRFLAVTVLGLSVLISIKAAAQSPNGAYSSPASSGSSGSGNSGALTFSPYTYGVKGGGKVTWYCTFSSGNTSITCPNASFNSADVGKIVYDTTGGQNGGQISGTIHIPLTTIATVVDATHITTVLAPTSNSGVTEVLVYGYQDGAALNTAWHAAADACGALNLGNDIFLTNRGQFNYTNAKCANAGRTGNMRNGESVYGSATYTAFIVPTPDFDFTTGVGNSCDGSGNGCFLSADDGLNAHDITFWGASLNLASGSGAVLARLISNQNGRYVNLNFMAFQASFAGSQGVILGSAWSIYDKLDIDGWGGQPLTVSGASIPTNPIQLSNSSAYDGARAGLQVVAGYFRSINNEYEGPSGSVLAACRVSSGAYFFSTNDLCTSGGTFEGTLTVLSGGHAFLTNAYINGTGNSTPAVTASGDVRLINSRVQETGTTSTGFSVGSAGVLWVDPITLNQTGATTVLSVTAGGVVHTPQSGTCVFAASTTCTVTFPVPYGSAPVFTITPVNPGTVTFTVTALSATGATITGSSSNSLTVGWTSTL